MSLQQMIQRVSHPSFFHKAVTSFKPVLREPKRFPYGAFRFGVQMAEGCQYTIEASTDLRYWSQLQAGESKSETFDYMDSEAFNHSYRFYRVMAGQVSSENVLGYASIIAPPGFSMLANPFQSTQDTVAEMFKGWPEGTSLSKFDATFFKLGHNEVKFGKWANSSERLSGGEGGIFFNPTPDYKIFTFVGELRQGNLAVPLPSGFSIRSAPVPQPGNLEDFGFPAADGDVVHLFDRERQQYTLHPYENGNWVGGAPAVGVGESFWVAKKTPGNWTASLKV